MDFLLGVLHVFLPSRLGHGLKKKKHLFRVFTRLKIRHHIPIIDLQVIHLFVTRYSGQVEIYLGFFKCVVTVFGCFFREQYDREQALDDFKTGKAKILIATDVASRGLDIRGVTWVIFPSSKVLWVMVLSPKNSYQLELACLVCSTGLVSKSYHVYRKEIYDIAFWWVFLSMYIINPLLSLRGAYLFQLRWKRDGAL